MTDALTERVSLVRQEGIDLFHSSFGGSNPIHTDQQAAKASEFGAPIQHGIRSMYPAFAMLAGRFGRSFLEGGRLKVKFIAPVVAGDVLTVRVDSSLLPPQGEPGFEWGIEGKNSLGKTVLAGAAHVAIEGYAG